jgi:large subunit ribosomal protein L25
MANLFELTAQSRADVGKGASRRLRKGAGLIPAIMYGAGKAPAKLSFKENEVRKATQNEAFFSHILTIHAPEGKQQVIIKDLQRHPYKDTILHMDFLRISATEKLTMKVPLHFIGEAVAPGVKSSGGILARLMNDLEIKCLPANLPAFIEVDVSALELNQALHLSDIKLPSGVELAHAIVDEQHNMTVVSVSAVKEVEEIEIGPAAVPTLGDEAAAKAAAEGGEAGAKKEAAPAAGKEAAAKKEPTKK